MENFTFVSCISAAAVGISFVQFVNNNSLRNIYILGLSLFLGISIPQYFITTTTADGVGPVRTDGIWVGHINKRLKLSP